MKTISISSIPRTDLIGRVRRAQHDLTAVGSLTDPVARSLPCGHEKSFESRVERFQQPSLQEMLGAARDEARVKEISSLRWAVGAGLTAGVSVALAAACAVGAPALVPLAIVGGGAASALSFVRWGLQAGRAFESRDVATVLEGWQIAYQQAAVGGKVPDVNSVGYSAVTGRTPTASAASCKFFPTPSVCVAALAHPT
jgi:hypothetical protein